jgi:glucosylceramidase
MRFSFVVPVLVCGFFIQASCKKSGSGTVVINPPPVAITGKADYWITSRDQALLLTKQYPINFSTATNSNPSILVDSAIGYQSIDGFGYTLTGGSAYVINRLPATSRNTLLRSLFSTDSNSIHISYLRISIGASDLSASVFTYNDIAAGTTDTNLSQFSLDPDKTDLIPLLKEIVALQPSIKIIATPWTAPVWMKDNNTSIGGSLKPEYYPVYARYFVKYIQQMKAEGINISAITPQNEPLNPNNNPSMVMNAADQATFIKTSLGPAFAAAAITTKIIVYDHNCDRPDYPISIFSDADASKYVDGSAFHLYGGDISALAAVYNAFPAKNLYFTEQYTSSTGDFGGDLNWHLKNVVIGATRNYSRTVLEWNLATDAAYGPQTPGGCSTCKGALTIGPPGITKNVAFYIIAHASTFVPPGSVRIASNIVSGLNNVAFLTPSGKKVLIVQNEGAVLVSFNIKFNNTLAPASLAAGAVATFVW